MSTSPILIGGGGTGTGFLTGASTDLATAISDETGAGVVVFNDTPTILTPIINQLYGSTAANGALKLTATTNASLGFIQANSGIKMFATDQTFTAKPKEWLTVNNTYTLDFASASLGGALSLLQTTASGTINLSPEVAFNQSGNTFSYVGIKSMPLLHNVSGVVANLGATPTWASIPEVRAVAASITHAATADLTSIFKFSTSGGGTLTTGTDYVNFECQLQVADAGVSMTNSSWAAFAYLAPSITGSAGPKDMYGVRLPGHAFGTTSSTGVLVGALTGPATNVGVDIAKPSGGTTNLGLRNAGPWALTPSQKTITATTDTIPHDSGLVQLNNTSGSSKTLAPAGNAAIVADGTNGEQLLIMNVGTSDVVLTDQGSLAGSNLRLAAATRTLSTRDSITLSYSVTIGDWVEVAFTNVI